MNHFSPLRYENIDGTRLKICEPFVFYVSSDEVIVVPDGFECDGQSYPRVLWIIDTPQGHGVKAGVVHDYLYWLNGRPASNGKSYSRQDADNIYFEALKDSGINAISCAIRYRALRMFGWLAWNSHARRIAKELRETTA